MLSVKTLHMPVHPNTGKKQIYISTNRRRTQFWVIYKDLHLDIRLWGNGLLLNNIFYLNDRANLSQSSNTQLKREMERERDSKDIRLSTNTHVRVCVCV